MLAAAIARAPSEVVVLPVDGERGETTLYQLQVTARSPMGAMALHTAGVLVDHGWLRLLGGGEGLMNFVSGNGIAASPQQPPDRLLVGFDVLGGRYEVNGGALPGEPGQVCYFAPDELAWIPLELGYGDFVLWTMTDRLALFNEHLRWHGWEDEVDPLPIDRGLSVYPPPFTGEGRDLARASRRPVPIAELFDFWQDAARQLRDVPPGGDFSVNITD